MSPLKYIYYALLLSGLFLLLARRKRLDKGLYIFIPLYCTVLATEAYYDLSGKYFIYHIEQLAEYTCLSFYYHRVLAVRMNRFLVIVGSSLFYMSCIIFFVRDTGNFFSFNHVDSMLVAVLAAVYSVLLLLEIYRNDEEMDFRQSAAFWVSIANLFFYAGDLLVSGFLQYLKLYGQKKLYGHMVYIIIALNFLLYSLYIKAFLCRPLQKKSD